MVSKFYERMCLPRGVNPNPLKDFPQLEWKEDLHKTSNISTSEQLMKTQSLHQNKNFKGQKK